MMNNINLNELTLENIGEWPTPVKIAAAAILAVLLIGLGYWFFIKPNFATYESLQNRERALKAEFEMKQRQAVSLNAYRNQLKEMEGKFGAMLQRLPAAHEMPALLEEISRTGTSSGLKFELFEPEPEITHDFYIEMPIKIEVVGNYHQIAVFISRIAKMDRIVTFHDFSLEHFKNKNNEKENGDKLKLTLTAKIYRYKSQ